MRDTLVSIFDNRGRTVWVSNGLELKDRLGVPVPDLYPESFRPKIMDLLSRCIVGGEAATYIAPSVSRDGELCHTTLLPIDSIQPAALAICMMLPPNFDQFTEDEKTLLRLLADDRSLRQVAKEMHLSESAIDTRVKKLKEKLGCKNIGGMIAAAIRGSII